MFTTPTKLPSRSVLYRYLLNVLFVYLACLGYGTLAPSTPAAQIIFIFYAIIGIPLALMFLAQIGSIIDKFIHALLKPIRQKWGATASRVMGITILFTFTFTLLILIPGGIFTRIETWNYRESVYFTVVTLTSVGFGDFVPIQAGSESTDVQIAMYKIISSIWLWVGLSLVSAVLTELQSLFKAVGKWFHTRTGHMVKNIVDKREPEQHELKSLGVVQGTISGDTDLRTSVLNENDTVKIT